MAENQDLVAAQAAADDAKNRAEAAEKKLAEAEDRIKAAMEPTSEEKAEKARRDTRRSAVRVRVTYLAASFLFVAGAGIVGYLLAVNRVEEAKDLFLAILPVSAAIVTYWFATRQGEPLSMDSIVKVIEAARKQS